MNAPRGVTLIELLVALSIVALLAALLLLAVLGSRESARRTECANHLRQVVLALHLHQTAPGRLPSGGWGYQWYGDPDRGTGPRQPGDGSMPFCLTWSVPTWRVWEPASPLCASWRRLACSTRCR